MKVMQFVRMLLKKGSVKPAFEYVDEHMYESPPAVIALPEYHPAEEQQEPRPVDAPADDIAFSPQGDLETYVRGLNVSKESIARWISAGVLLPEETKIAQKMLQIMRRNEKTGTSG